MPTKQTIAAQVRWMIRVDMPEVLKIENESFDVHWTEEEFVVCLRQKNNIGMVAEHDNQVVGFMIYELHKTKLHILNFAVASGFRRCGIGSQMIDNLVYKLSQQRRTEIVLEVRERNLVAQQFYHSQGFRSVGVLREHYVDSGEDAYQMLYRLDAPADIIIQNDCGCICRFTATSNFVDGIVSDCRFHRTRPRLISDVIRKAERRKQVILQLGQTDLSDLRPFR